MLLMVPLFLIVVSAEEHSVYNGPGTPLEEQEGEGLSLYSSHAVPSDFGVGTSNINIFGPVVSKLPYGTHYVYWREGQYEYRLAYGESLEYDGSRFLGDSVEVVTYRTNTGYGSQATFVYSAESNFTLSPGSYLVWSDLGHYPTLYERGVQDYVETACFGLAVCFVLWLIKSLFRGLGR